MLFLLCPKGMELKLYNKTFRSLMIYEFTKTKGIRKNRSQVIAPLTTFIVRTKSHYT